MTHSWCPDSEGELLLLAAIGDRATAGDAWASWSASHMVSDLSLGAARLLPLIDHNLQQHGIGGLSGEAAETLASMWCELQLLYHEAGEMLRALEAAAVSTIVLKGAAHAFLDYPDPFLRPMSDVDVLVRAGDVRRAVAALRGSGWTPAGGSTEALSPYQHGMSFTNGSGVAVDLHSRTIWQGTFLADDDRGFWERSVPLTLEGAACRALSPEDRLLHTCVHGTEWSPMLPIRWVADAAMIVRRHGGSLDWDRLVEQARARRLTLPVAEALTYLDEKCAIPVPHGPLTALCATPASPLVRLTHRARTGREGSYLSHLNDWAVGWRLQRSRPVHRKLADFMTWFAASRGLRHVWQAPFSLGRTAVRVGVRLLRDR